MSKARLEQSRPRPRTSPGDRGVVELGSPEISNQKHEKCAVRAQVVNDPEQRADLLRFAGMWLSLTEPIEDEFRGAYELSPQTA